MSGSLSIGSLKKPAVLIPLGLFLGSLLLRLLGIGWGLPNGLHNQSYHPDEDVNFLSYAQGVDIAHGQFLPGHYNYGTAYFIAFNLTQDMMTAYGGGPQTTDGSTKQAQLKALGQYIGRCELGGRVLNALAGAGTVAVVWLILRRITTRFGALFGSGLVAVAPGFLVHSRFETVDVFATFWLALSACFALRILGVMPGSIGELDAREPRDMKDALLAGLFAGIAAGTKYTGVLVILVLWVTLGMTRRPRWWVAALAGTALSFVAFCLTTPGFLFDSANFWRDFDFELIHTKTGHGLIFIGTQSGYLYHLVNLAVGIGILATVAGLIGLGFGAFRKHSWAIALLVFTVVYYVAIAGAEVKFLRYTFPLLVPLAVGYGYAMGSAFRLRTRPSLGLAAIGVFALTGTPFGDFGGLIGGLKYTQFMTWTDPRDEVAEYLTQSAPNASVGFVDDPWFYSPALIPDAGLNRGQLKTIYEEVAASEHPKVVRYVPAEGFDRRVDWDVRLLTEIKPDYVVFSSFEYDDVNRLSQLAGLEPGVQSIVDNYKAFMPELQKRYRCLPQFGGGTPPIHDLMYIRPTLWVWKRNDLP